MEVELKDQLEKIFIHEDSRNTPVAERARQMFAPEKIFYVNSKPLPDTGVLTPKQFDRSKRWLYLTPFKGSFFKQCPGAGGMLCCNYFVLNLGLQCNMNCSYCYLQSYINTPLLTVYTNIERALEELDVLASKHPDKPYRVGTGETTDSLSLDSLTQFSKTLVEFFKKYPSWTLEFKTKSSCVDEFVEESHAGNVVVSWSINAPKVVAQEEHGTAPLLKRLQSARRVLDKGYRVAFHIDPMIWHPEWEESYGELVRLVTENFKPDEVPSITVGALRFQPEQKIMMKERFGMSSLVNRGELFPTREGKLRYDQELRNEMFNFVMTAFRNHNPNWRVWLCMENSETWAGTYQEVPTKIPELREFFRPLPAKIGLAKPTLQP
jgi:spore photoproduct lyase